MIDADALLGTEAKTGFLLRLDLMGRMRASNAIGDDVLPRVRKTRAVLAIVALAAPRPVLRDHIAALLWSTRDREQARGSLRQCVHELQDILGALGPELLLADRGQLTLRDQDISIDIRDGHATEADAVLLEDLFGLDPAFDLWLLTQRRRLTREPAPDPAEAALVQDAERAAGRVQHRRRGARLGVMPFRSLGGADEDPLSFGLAEEITTALSRFRWFYLIASPSLAAVADETRETSDRWRALDLDFLLDGTVQHGRNRVRVRVRLVDVAAGGEVIWTNSFDRSGEDLLTLQDEIAAETVARIDPELMLREGRRAASCHANVATAYDLVLRSISAIYRLEEVSFRAAGQTLAEAVALAPDYAAGHAWFACWHIFLVGQNWAHNPAAAMAYAGDLVDRAVMLDPHDARALTLSGHVNAFLHGRIDEAIDLHDRALALNPNLPMAWAFSGLAYSYSGMHEDALIRMENALRLSPYDPHAFFFEMAKMLPTLMLGSFKRVVQIGKHSIALNPSCTSTYKLLLSACGHLGLAADIAHFKQRLLQLEPGFRVTNAIRRSCLTRAVDRELYGEGLRRAGLPE